MNKKVISAEILAKLTAVKTALSALVQKDPAAETILKTKDGKELKFSGELKPDTEIKCGDAAIEDGTFELADGRKLTAKGGKFEKFEDVQLSEIETLRNELTASTALMAQLKASNESLEARFGKLLESTNQVFSAVENIASLVDIEDNGNGGNPAPGKGMTKAEWVVLNAQKGN